MATEHITDHIARALSRQTQQFKSKPNLEAFITAIVRPIQRLEDVAWQLYTERGLELAVGVQLDVLGVLVGEEREGKLDEAYRRHLRARVRANRSNGTVEDLLAITRLILDDEDAELIMEPGYPAGLTLLIDGITLTEAVAETLIRMLRVAAAAGVKFLLVWYPAADAAMFTLARAAFLSAPLAGGEVTINVVSTTGFPTSGSLELDTALAVEEIVTYTGITPTSFTGVSAVANAHATGAAASWVQSPGLGLGADADPLDGGQLAGVKE
jgi:hypothetical protein